MQNPFGVRELVPPGFFRRLFDLPAPENAYIEFENLLASRPWTEIRPGDVEKVLERHGVRSMNADRARDLYRRAVAAVAADDVVDREEVGALECLRNLLGIRDAEGVVETLLRQRWQDAVRDRRLSPAERQSLDAFARNFGVHVNVDPATQAQLDRFHWYWLMENGTFPSVAVNLNLQRGELCHFAAAAVMYELRTETQRVNYAGPGIRIRIMKGVYYRAGSVSTERVTRDVLRQIDSGTLYVTNRRIIFDGARKNATIRLSNVLSVTPYADAVGVEKTSGRNPIFTVADPEWLAVLLASRVASQ